ncbi:MAG: DUF1622 domain-containing protein [Enterococcus sp.]
MSHLEHHLMEQLLPFFEIIVLFLNVLSIVVILWGVIIASFDFIKSEFHHTTHLRAARQNNFIKNFLGSYILLSLEILIAADIIESIINPTWMDLLFLAAVVVIRTVISYFLHQEIQDALGTPDDFPTILNKKEFESKAN